MMIYICFIKQHCHHSNVWIIKLDIISSILFWRPCHLTLRKAKVVWTKPASWVRPRFQIRHLSVTVASVRTSRIWWIITRTCACSWRSPTITLRCVWRDGTSTRLRLMTSQRGWSRWKIWSRRRRVYRQHCRKNNNTHNNTRLVSQQCTQQ